MCGIAGIVKSDNSNVVRRDILQTMCDVMVHRGPDEDGFYVNSNVGLGMRRLKVIDLSTGSQPIFNEDRSVVVVLNGEIYNYRELRDILISKGHYFYTKSDTEVIVHLYEEYGDNCVSHLNGMFAIALWDTKEKVLLLYRDRLGEKPLHYYVSDTEIIFSSEIKSLLCNKTITRELDYEALYHYFSFYCIPAPLTIYRNIRKLLPAHYLKFKMGTIDLKQYWDFSYNPDFNKTEDEFADHLRDLLIASLKKRMISDVPLGAFLSGGIDSSVVVALMTSIMDRPVKTFSIGFEENRFNELEYARVIAKTFNTDHHELTVKSSDVDLIDSLIGFFDEPFGGPSAIPTYLVSKFTREHVTVALTGDGGDEVFYGYDSYPSALKRKKLNLLPQWLKNMCTHSIGNRLPYGAFGKRFLQSLSLTDEEHFCLGVSEYWKKDLFSEDFLKEINKLSSFDIVRPHVLDNDTEYLSKLAYMDTKLYLPNDVLVKVDRMSMANSLETRILFLDHEIVEFAGTIPASLKLKQGISKYILKKSLKRLIPDQILERGKWGFALPVSVWFRNELKDTIIASVERIGDYGLFNSQFIKDRLFDHLSSQRDHPKFLWSLLVFQKWYDDYYKQH